MTKDFEGKCEQSSLRSEKKLCSADKSCACVDGYCKKPEWMEGWKDSWEKACGNDEVSLLAI